MPVPAVAGEKLPGPATPLPAYTPPVGLAFSAMEGELLQNTVWAREKVMMGLGLTDMFILPVTGHPEGAVPVTLYVVEIVGEITVLDVEAPLLQV